MSRRPSSWFVTDLQIFPPTYCPINLIPPEGKRLRETGREREREMITNSICYLEPTERSGMDRRVDKGGDTVGWRS
jgi:hypothetical protein